MKLVFIQGAFTCKELAESFGLVITPTDDGQATIPQNHWDCLDTVVVIDSTWQQTHQILKVIIIIDLSCHY